VENETCHNKLDLYLFIYDLTVCKGDYQGEWGGPTLLCGFQKCNWKLPNWYV